MKYLKTFEKKITFKYPDDFVGFEGDVYFIAPNFEHEKKPWTRDYVINDFDEALRRLDVYEKSHTYDYGIYKANIKPLTKEEIELYKTSKKYNL